MIKVQAKCDEFKALPLIVFAWAPRACRRHLRLLNPTSQHVPPALGSRCTHPKQRQISDGSETRAATSIPGAITPTAAHRHAECSSTRVGTSKVGARSRVATAPASPAITRVTQLPSAPFASGTLNSHDQLVVELVESATACQPTSRRIKHRRYKTSAD
jgi:hypothetical protein